MGISLADLTSLRGCITSFCPESAMIARTGLTVPARVVPMAREFHPEGMTTSMRLRLWAITFPNNTSVIRGDQVTIAGMGTYAVLDVNSPQSYSISDVASAIMTKNLDGSSPMPSNATVTFEQTGQNAAPKKTANVWIYCANCEPLLDAYAAQWKWGAYVDPLFRYANGGVLQQGDKIHWPDLEPNGYATIQGPQRIYGMFPYWRLYFVARD